METPTPATPPASPALPLPSGGTPNPLGTTPHPRGKVVSGCKCGECEAKRAEWREKDRKRRNKGNPFSVEPERENVVKLGASPAVAPAPAPAGGPVAPPKPFVPWTVSLVRPLCSQTANIIERWDGNNLIEEAAKVSELVRDFVAARVAWNAEAKTMLVDGAAECAVKYLNLSGVSAEYAPELKLGLAALAIVSSRQELVATLRKMAEEAKAKAEAKPAAEEKKAA